MKKTTFGFTLIELVVVIVILGILAVTAAPKLLNMASDARKSTLNGAYGAMKGAIAMTNAKSILNGDKDKPISYIKDGGEGIQMYYGYPSGQDNILNAMDMGDVGIYGGNYDNSQHDWVWQGHNQGGRVGIQISQGSFIGNGPGAPNPKDTNCFIEYFPATKDKLYELNINTDGC